jgi:RHS repeat-associated protein
VRVTERLFDHVTDAEEEAARPRVLLGSLMTHKRDASGQIYMRNRYFDPTSGRFTQEDPIGIAGGLNLYGFGGGAPMTYTDPYGLSAEDCCRLAGPTPRRTPDDPRPQSARAGVGIQNAIAQAVGAGVDQAQGLYEEHKDVVWMVAARVVSRGQSGGTRGGGPGRGTFFVDGKGSVIPTPPGGVSPDHPMEGIFKLAMQQATRQVYGLTPVTSLPPIQIRAPNNPTGTSRGGQTLMEPLGSR